MKNDFTEKDALELRNTIISQIKDFTNNENENVLLLSGGIDSCVVLFSLLELGKPFKVINFNFFEKDGVDRTSVKKLQNQIGFKAEYINLNGIDMDVLKKSISLSKKVFGRIREVKVETMYAMEQVKIRLPKTGVNILTGFGGDDVGGYSRKQQIEIANLGEENEVVLKRRAIKPDQDEFRAVFSGYNYFTPYTNQEIQKKILDYTTKAWNKRFPKSALVYTFSEYFKKYKSARKPIGLHKSGEQVMFEIIAKEKGYSSALQMFNKIGGLI